jgi:hypothetical protein
MEFNRMLGTLTATTKLTKAGSSITKCHAMSILYASQLSSDCQRIAASCADIFYSLSAICQPIRNPFARAEKQ